MNTLAGRYSLDALLGRGGMGEVHLGTQLSVGNRVAVKLMRPPAADPDAYRKRFLAEARIGVSLSHPGIAQVLDAGEDQGQLFIVFEFVEGEDLRHLIDREGPLPWPKVREIVLRLGEALAYAHGKGVVHRDVKPENVRVRQDIVGLHVKVLDFGIARRIGDSRLTAEGSFAGTPSYTSPEQIEGVEVDGRADLYCLGLIAWELITGKPVVASKSPSAALVAQMTGEMPRLGDGLPERSWPALDELLARACAKEPTARLPDVASFLSAFAKLDDPRWPERAAPQVASVQRANARNDAPTLPGRPSISRTPIVPEPLDVTEPSAPRPNQLATPLPETRKSRAVGRTTTASTANPWPLRGLVAGALVVVVGGAGWAMRDAPVQPPAPAPIPVPVVVVATAPPPKTEPVVVPVIDAGVAPIAIVEPPSVRRPHQPPPPTKKPPAAPEPPGGVAPPANGGLCPQLAQYAEEYRALSADELRARISSSRAVPPSGRKRTIAQVEGMSPGFDPGVRDCVTRAMFVSQVIAFQTMARQDGWSFVHERGAAWAEGLYRRAELNRQRTPERREEILAQVREVLAAPAPEDLAWVHEDSLIDLLACELSDAELAKLHAPRRTSCRYTE